MEIDIAAFMQHIRDRGFTVEDYGVVSGVRRFFIAQQERRVAYFDIDELAWPDVTQDWLVRQVDSIMDDWQAHIASEYAARVARREQVIVTKQSEGGSWIATLVGDWRSGVGTTEERAVGELWLMYGPEIMTKCWQLLEGIPQE